jgi:rhamnopyranosyl-N-acetylglucosaminyl-diphospho-decaprenol beta-1,3/1,4-galactofuranosyltransferase
MAKEQEGETAFYCPLPSKYGKEQLTRNAKLIIESYPEKIIKNFLHPFNGCLIKRTVVSRVGLPLKELFVWGDETNYFLRAVRCGISCGTIVNARFWHPKDRQSVRIVNFGFRSVFLPYSDLPEKFYLIVRNWFYNSWLYGSRVNAVAKLLLYVFFFPTKVSLILRALFDALRLLGQYKPKC